VGAIVIGKTISHYEILEELGRGGMGVVYKAEDTKLRRTVALKFLPAQMTRDLEARARFVQEAQAASALDHPNICTIHEIDETDDGSTFIVMACYEGETLKERIKRGPLDPAEALDIAYQVSEGLHEAHEKEIVHRDVKPANIMVTTRGQVKIMDFGLAKLRGQTVLTREGTTLGTVSYMSPEQARGEEVDHRTDIWSLGVVLYEMLTGRRPFRGEYDQAVIYSILNDDPAAPSGIREEVPPEVDAIVLRALKRNPEERFRSVHEFQQALAGIGAGVRRVAESGGAGTSFGRVLRKPAVMIPLIVAVCIIIFFRVRYYREVSRERRVRREVLPEITELVEAEKYYTAYERALQIKDTASDDPVFQQLWAKVTTTTTVLTSPEGADLFIQEYTNPDGMWRSIGRTQLESAVFPRGFFRWRIRKEGYIPIEVARYSRSDTLRFKLDEIGSIPEGMVRVPAGLRRAWIVGFGWFDTAPLPDFLIDKYEVTNEQFQAFVDSGGYRRREYWKHDFVYGDRSLSWDEAMLEFKDRTGRPGPATWELGTFPEGEGDHPVTGVSWFEAAAYAEFSGKRLPTVHHWISTASIRHSAYIIPLSNFGRDGLAPVGSHHGLGRFGEYDLAGNAREWCFNATGGERYLMGGCWSDPSYTFNYPEKRSPFDRSPCSGFRCVKLIDGFDITDAAWQDIPHHPARDYGTVEPVSDEVFEAYRSVYLYDKTPLNARVELMDDEPEHWTIEKISFDAAYGNERMIAYLFIPRDISPPYQTIVLFCGAQALSIRSSNDGKTLNSFGFIDFVIRSGRAALFPIYKSTFERRDGYSIYDPSFTFSDHRSHFIMWRKDFARSVDYLETRDDIDHDRIAYFGSSLGGWMAPLILGQDRRFRTAVLRLVGLPYWEVVDPPFDPVNFITRITIPVLMFNGKYDYIFPHETSQVPFYEHLGTPPEDKRHVLFETAHSTYGHRNEMIRETLDWLDRYMGPVK
jgi:hypothetical protein